MCARAGQEEGVPEVAVPELRLATNSFTADQYPGWTHVSSANAKEPHFNNRELKKKKTRTVRPRAKLNIRVPAIREHAWGNLGIIITLIGRLPPRRCLRFLPCRYCRLG